MLLYRGSGNEGEGCRPECPPDPATTLRWNPTSEIVTQGRASGVIDDVQLRPSSSRPCGLVRQGRGQDEVVSPTIIEGLGRGTVMTQQSSTVVDSLSTSLNGGPSINSCDRGQRVSLQDSSCRYVWHWRSKRWTTRVSNWRPTKRRPTVEPSGYYYWPSTWPTRDRRRYSTLSSVLFCT